MFENIWHGSILGGSLKRSLGMAKLQKQCNHPQILPWLRLGLLAPALRFAKTSRRDERI